MLFTPRVAPIYARTQPILGTRYYHGLTRKYIASFGALFNDVHILRDGTDVEQLIRLPLVYARKEKMNNILLSSPDMNRPSAVNLPRISFELAAVNYASERQLQPVQRRAGLDSSNANNFKQQYGPVPFDFTFLVHIYTKNQEDGLKVLEQVLPHFTPTLSMTVTLIPDMPDTRDLAITLQDVSYTDTFDGKLGDVRMVTYTLQFVMQAYLFGPVRSRPVIKVVDVNFHPTTNTAEAPDSHGIVLSVYPGQDANGVGTTNAQVTVSYSQIFANSDWDYVTTISDDWT